MSLNCLKYLKEHSGENTCPVSIAKDCHLTKQKESNN